MSEDKDNNNISEEQNDSNATQEDQLSEEELIKRKIEELRKRDPFVYR